MIQYMNHKTNHLADSFITQYQVRDIYVIECVAMAHGLLHALYKDLHKLTDTSE